MHILILTKEYRPIIKGGSSIAAVDLADRLLHLGDRVTVVVPRGRRLTVTSHGRLTVVRLPSGAGGASLRAVRRHLNCDIIHVHSYRIAPLAFRIQRLNRAPMLYTCHSLARLESLSDRRRALANQVSTFRRSRWIIAPSYWEERAIRRYYPVSARKTVVIANGVYIPRRAAIGWNAHPYRLLYVGRVVRSKGVDALLRAVAILKRTHPNVTLTLIGYDTGGQRARLRRLAGRLGVVRNVRWLGGRSHSATLAAYRRYGAVIMPSRMEAFGLVALEALAQGVPLVSTRRGGLSDFVSGRVAQVLPAISGPAIAAGIRSVWSRRKLTALRVSAGRRLALRYSLGASAAKYRWLYARVRRGA